MWVHLSNRAGPFVQGSWLWLFYRVVLCKPSDNKQAIMTMLTCSSSAQKVEECRFNWYDGCNPSFGASSCKCENQPMLIGLRCGKWQELLVPV
ncbi:hypothetical protein DPMN_170768 [Dreissena polymorpha]|uniref:Secreted protein n=2 Tax=Dreissena polymorpha TaxID=45954 RepID=A0A9D4DZW6_DREPO|nr:hypothetical protein DPMN_170768 [Dreissena polymorpha]